MESDILLAPTLRVDWSKSISLSSLVGEFPYPPGDPVIGFPKGNTASGFCCNQWAPPAQRQCYALCWHGGVLLLRFFQHCWEFWLSSAASYNSSSFFRKISLLISFVRYSEISRCEAEKAQKQAARRKRNREARWQNTKRYKELKYFLDNKPELW